jgi:hypothetical protein
MALEVYLSIGSPFSWGAINTGSKAVAISIESHNVLEGEEQLS